MAIVRPISARSNRSLKSSILNMSVKNLWIYNEKWTRKAFDYLKLLIIVLPPIAIVMTLCSMSLVSGKNAIDIQMSLQKNLEASQAIGNLATVLAQERGKTCLYLT